MSVKVDQCLGPCGLLAVCKQQEFISDSLKAVETNVVIFLCEPSSFSVLTWWEGPGGSLWSLFYKALILFKRAPSSWVRYLQKVPSPNTSIFGG